MLGRTVELLRGAGHAPLLDRRRAQAILARVRAFALFLAGLTLAFIAMDAAFLPPSNAGSLAVARVGAAAALAALWWLAGAAPPTLARARAALAALFAIPAAFFVFAYAWLPPASAPGASRLMETTYAFAPYLLACGISAFPLMARESAMVALIAVAAQTWLLVSHGARAAPPLPPESSWLLLLITAIAAFSALSQVRLMAQLVMGAARDPLTGCLRREAGMEILESQLALALRRGTPLAVLFADLDRFKDVNDRFGHEAGDEVLAAAASSLRAALRESDSLLRWGGEEFVVVLPDTTLAAAARIVERLGRAPVARLPDGGGMTLSVGIAEYRTDAVASVDALVGLADTRMYLAKQAGRNRYVSRSSGEAIPLCAVSAA